MIDEWRPILGPPRYEVSRDGRVRNVVTGKILKTVVTRRGYGRVGLHSDQGPTHTLVHRLVYEAWVGPIPDGTEINHIDGNKLNNISSNLEAVTRAANMVHAKLNGLFVTKLTAEKVVAIRAARASGEKYASIAKRYGVGAQTVSNVCQRIYWVHVP